MDVRRTIDHLVRDLGDRVAREHGFLTSIRVTRPPEVSGPELKSVLSERLADAGLDFVDIDLVDRDGDITLLAAEFEHMAGEAGRPRLLLAVDLAEPQEALVDRALVWAERLDATISLVFAGIYANVSAMFLDRTLSDLLGNEVERLRVEDLRRLESLLDRVPEHHRGRMFLVDKPTVEGILDIEAPFDVLLVGTHGRRGLARLTLGSVAERLVRLSSKTVVVLRTAPVRERPPG